MRVLVTVMIVAFISGLLVFLYYNSEKTVPIEIGGTLYPEVPVFLVVVLASLGTILFVGIIAVAEGANIRLANRRLRKEIHQLETEINYLRTQPASEIAERGAAPAAPRDADRKDSGSRSGPLVPSSAPVYGTEDDRDADDDDIYSGGRAV